MNTNKKLSEVAGDMIGQLRHTATPWKVMADPKYKGKHPCHDVRWIVSGDAEVALALANREGSK